ncbi:FAD-dependent oxidoreductase [Aspergillus lucknowensis]|uniref:FAD-binding domain-containing protein n=1 Tax=Aspergillus lucknowensis TaxID=176173 RepID=A0ABR4LY60_9EURO
MAKPNPNDPVLIVGAGITGLILAHALKQKNIPFIIYERDPTPSSRHQGWALTLHWALQYLPSLLSRETLAQIETETQVDPEIAKNDSGNFLFLNLATGDVKWRIPPNKRWRVNRERFRGVLIRELGRDAGAGGTDTDSHTHTHIQWGRKVEGVTFDESGRPRLLFLNGEEEKEEESIPGRLVIGAEGSHSAIRQFLRPDNYVNSQLPIRFTGVAVDLSADEVAPLRAMDPLLFQGCHPETGIFLWFSMLDTPEREHEHLHERPSKESKSKARPYRAQLGLSWSVRSPSDEVPPTDAERLSNMKRRAAGFAPFLYETIQRIPEGTPVVEVKLADWECEPWDNREGTVTLAGDAAHAMTMYRGEAGNHGILDIFHLVPAIEKIYAGADAKGAIDAYESEMRERTQRAVRLSRQACFDAHDWESLNEDSAILARRKL